MGAVKRLEWVGQEDGAFVAKADTGEYTVADPKERNLWLWTRDFSSLHYGMCLGASGFLDTEAFPTKEAAMAAAQADMDARLANWLTAPLETVKAQVRDETLEKAAQEVEATTDWEYVTQKEMAAAIRTMKGGA